MRHGDVERREKFRDAVEMLELPLPGDEELPADEEAKHEEKRTAEVVEEAEHFHEVLLEGGRGADEGVRPSKSKVIRGTTGTGRRRSSRGTTRTARAATA